MRLFISAGEPSGDLHGANLIRGLRRHEPGLELHGMGGERMASAGCRIVYPLCDMAMIGLFQITANLFKFWGILRQADRWLREHRPDAVVLIDYPGFHWWLARRAHAQNIPVYYFVPPQIWGWATWRAGKMRTFVRQTLCTLPFEEKWFNERGIPARFIGHPYFDELRGQRLDEAFLSDQRTRPGPIVAILPGSRGQELHYNLDSQLEAARLIHARRPDVRFLVACFREEHRRRVEGKLRGLHLPIEAHVGRTPEIIELAHCCLSVSGSVSLELLFRAKPAVMIYQHHWFCVLLGHILKRARFITLVNMLAERELFPEYFSHRSLAEPMARHALGWLENSTGYEALRGELRALRERVAVPGACERAATALVELVHVRHERRAA
jgi:lipid-A-disaccharide synthase